ncbi:MAG: hypothetical protein JST30_02110 [Armatimonadetes bacterium]|nr:hypothetical protein [Armatimonadota bacterium]
MNLSSIGNGAHNTRSINVCVNLLTEWASDQARLKAEMSRYALVTGLALVFAAVTVPVLERVGAQESSRQRALESRLAGLQAQLRQVQAEKDVVAPKVERAQVLAETRGRFDRFLGELYVVLDAAKTGLAFATAKIEVRSAEIVVNCRADAESYEAAATFADLAGRTPNKVSTLSSTRPSTLLSSNGVSFEYLKKVPLP